MPGELLRRRVPQIVGLYVVGSWGFVQFVDWTVEQYALSPHITNFSVVLLLLLLPSVLLLAWRHGAPGHDRWTRTESIVVPLNLLVAAAVLYVGFAGKPLGAVTTTLVIEDETGNQVERVVPRDQFRTSVAMFPFENATVDTTYDWLQSGLMFATQIDLYQDMFITVVSPWCECDDGRLLRELQEAGFEDGTGASLALHRKLAVEHHVDFLLMGSFVRSDSVFVVETRLYDPPRARLLAERTFRGADPLEVVDQLSEQLKRDMGLPAVRIREAQDLPIAEMLTHSVSAFKQYVLGGEAFFRNDMDASLRWTVGAVEEDPTFAAAQWGLALGYFMLNQPEESAAALRASQQHSYKLPERLQLLWQTMDYMLFQQKPEEAVKHASYMVELYPQAVEGRLTLADLYEQRGQWREQIEQLDAVLSIDPTQLRQLKTIGQIYQEQGQFEAALQRFERYAEMVPNDAESFVAIGEARRLMGQHELARAAFEQALRVEPGETTVMTKLLRLERDLGNFQRAHEWADDALAASRGPEDLLEAYDLLETLYYRQGRFQQVEDNYPRLLAAANDAQDPVSAAYLVVQSKVIQSANEVGREAFAFRQMDSLRAGLPPPLDDLHGVMYAVPLAEAGNLGRARAELDRGEAAVELVGLDFARALGAYGAGLISEKQGDCRRATESYDRALALSPNFVDVAVARGRCQRELGELQAAEATLQDVLEVIPAEGKALFELALVYERMDRTADAIEHLQAATDIWKNADPDYRPAQNAQAKLAELEGGG